MGSGSASMKIKTTKFELTIYVILFIIFIVTSYILPQVVIFLFTIPFGIGILLFAIALVTYFYRNLGFGILSVFVILYVSIYLSMKTQTEGKKEGYNNKSQSPHNKHLQNGWTPELIHQFKSYQKSHNPTYNFDMNIIQQQVNSEEVKEYLKQGSWKWSPEIQHLYKAHVEREISIRYNPNSALVNAQKIYNEVAIKELLSWNTKEGYFILNGATTGHTKNLPKNINNTVQCDATNGELMQVTNRKANGAPGFMVQNYTPIQPEALPSLINGFSFLKEPCNPCAILNQDIISYNCPFSLNIGDGGNVSPIWAHLWGIDGDDSDSKKKTKNKRTDYVGVNLKHKNNNKKK